MRLCLVGLNYRSASVGLRERFTVPSRTLPDALRQLQRVTQCHEALILSTCNRIELYVVTPDPHATTHALIDFLSYQSRLSPAEFQPQLYCLDGVEAMTHAFRVTAGLDSIIVGESEITAQVKEAYTVAQAHDMTGPLLNRLFQKALHAAKEIRSRTGIAQGHASIGAVVTQVAEQLFAERLATSEVLLWGAGKAAETTARHLIKRGIGQLWIVNRTPLKAQDLAALCQGGWLSWEQARGHLAHVDIAIVCTQAPHYVIDANDLAAIRDPRGGRPLCLIDLAVPRNIDPALARHPGITLYNIDDLHALAEAGVSARRAALPQCHTLIDQHIRHLLHQSSTCIHKEAIVC